MNKYAQAINKTNGKFFVVRFIKKDGSERKLVGRTGVKKYVKGVGRTFTPPEHLLTVWDVNVNVRDYRFVNTNNCIYFKCGEVLIDERNKRST